MYPELKINIPSSFSPQSRIWIYQINRTLSEQETLIAEKMLQSFTNKWSSHGKVVNGKGLVILNHFILLIADESSFAVSGCSTDSSVRLMKEIEKELNINLFDRQTLAFYIGEEIVTMPLSDLKESLEKSIVTSRTLYFNNVIGRLEELNQKWLIPVQESWLAAKIKTRSINV